MIPVLIFWTVLPYWAYCDIDLEKGLMVAWVATCLILFCLHGVICYKAKLCLPGFPLAVPFFLAGMSVI